jgi:hypothetical protein
VSIAPRQDCRVDAAAAVEDVIPGVTAQQVVPFSAYEGVIPGAAQ